MGRKNLLNSWQSLILLITLLGNEIIAFNLAKPSIFISYLLCFNSYANLLENGSLVNVISTEIFKHIANIHCQWLMRTSGQFIRIRDNFVNPIMEPIRTWWTSAKLFRLSRNFSLAQPFQQRDVISNQFTYYELFNRLASSFQKRASKLPAYTHNKYPLSKIFGP